jgi:serine/threonine protein phosphatase PrpC
VDPHSVLQLPEGMGTVGRVCGLAVSRSIGARYAYPYVIPAPDVSEVQVMCEAYDHKQAGGRDGGAGSAAMGGSSLSEPAANVTAGDVWALLLCSDGVWDALTDQEAAEVAFPPQPLPPPPGQLNRAAPHSRTVLDLLPVPSS